ncbi:MAG: pdeM [Rhodocyclales bacterium]|nr:pdeM [Rhodocyclales bacterium]
MTRQMNTAGSPADMAIEVAGETLVLLPERALWWPGRHTLIVADVHFGKSSVFRTHGVPVPAGSTDDNLARLNACIARYPAQRLLCLGDLTHARSGHTPQLVARLGDFREQHPDMHIELVRGNHDRHAGVPEVLRVTVHEDPHLDGPFSLRHEPPRNEEGIDSGYVLAGHVHPAIVLSTQHDRIRVPCFAVSERMTILPAFGAFTGMHALEMTAGTSYYAALEERVLGPIRNQAIPEKSHDRS